MILTARCKLRAGGSWWPDEQTFGGGRRNLFFYLHQVKLAQVATYERRKKSLCTFSDTGRALWTPPVGWCPVLESSTLGWSSEAVQAIKAM